MAHNLCLNVFNFSLIAMITSISESLILTEPESAKTKSSIRFSDASNYKRSQVITLPVQLLPFTKHFFPL